MEEKRVQWEGFMKQVRVSEGVINDDIMKRIETIKPKQSYQHTYPTSAAHLITT